MKHSYPPTVSTTPTSSEVAAEHEALAKFAQFFDKKLDPRERTQLLNQRLGGYSGQETARIREYVLQSHSLADLLKEHFLGYQLAEIVAGFGEDTKSAHAEESANEILDHFGIDDRPVRIFGLADVHRRVDAGIEELQSGSWCEMRAQHIACNVGVHAEWLFEVFCNWIAAMAFERPLADLIRDELPQVGDGSRLSLGAWVQALRIIEKVLAHADGPLAGRYRAYADDLIPSGLLSCQRNRWAHYHTRFAQLPARERRTRLVESLRSLSVYLGRLRDNDLFPWVVRVERTVRIGDGSRVAYVVRTDDGSERRVLNTVLSYANTYLMLSETNPDWAMPHQFANTWPAPPARG